MDGGEDAPGSGGQTVLAYACGPALESVAWADSLKGEHALRHAGMVVARVTRARYSSGQHNRSLSEGFLQIGGHRW